LTACCPNLKGPRVHDPQPLAQPEDCAFLVASPATGRAAARRVALRRRTAGFGNTLDTAPFGVSCSSGPGRSSTGPHICGTPSAALCPLAPKAPLP
jgi:hypothetical protein